MTQNSHLSLPGSSSKPMKPITSQSHHRYTKYNNFNFFHVGRQLFQQYIDDQIGTVEYERVPYLRRKQQKLRAAQYTTLFVHLGDRKQGNNETKAVRSGRLFVPLPTRHGGYRYMPKITHGYISISNEPCHPDILPATTCNLKRSEITQT